MVTKVSTFLIPLGGFIPVYRDIVLAVLVNIAQGEHGRLVIFIRRFFQKFYPFGDILFDTVTFFIEPAEKVVGERIVGFQFDGMFVIYPSFHIIRRQRAAVVEQIADLAVGLVIALFCGFFIPLQRFFRVFLQFSHCSFISKPQTVLRHAVALLCLLLEGCDLLRSVFVRFGRVDCPSRGIE